MPICVLHRFSFGGQLLGVKTANRSDSAMLSPAGRSILASPAFDGLGPAESSLGLTGCAVM